MKNMKEHENSLESTESLSADTRDLHRALVSLEEELEAIDHYRQRADACRDPQLKEVLLHNMHEEVEHSVMLIEWLRRNKSTFNDQLRTYAFTEAPITEVGNHATVTARVLNDMAELFTIGSLKE